MHKKYLLFDMDGTLVESLGDIIEITFLYLKEFFPDLEKQHVQYAFYSGSWARLFEILRFLFSHELPEILQLHTDNLYKKLSQVDGKFFPWVCEKIHELSQTYQLFLTTGNTTQTAKKYLSQWGILDKFTCILWSELIPKGREHMQYFFDSIWDDDFFHKSVYIGDSNADREIAKSHNIDFIHIGNDWIDRYEIQSVVQINDILSQFT